jgi:hypothetical protein
MSWCAIFLKELELRYATLRLPSVEMRLERLTSGSCPANVGRGNRAMETPRCLVRDESFGGCYLRECGGKQTKISTVNR